jgi:hypothetical protein
VNHIPDEREEPRVPLIRLDNIEKEFVAPKYSTAFGKA